MAAKKPLAIKAKKPKPRPYYQHTIEETRAIDLFIAAFGHLTYVREMPTVRRWIGRGRRCPECDTHFNEGDWPRCRWCNWTAQGVS